MSSFKIPWSWLCKCRFHWPQWNRPALADIDDRRTVTHQGQCLRKGLDWGDWRIQCIWGRRVSMPKWGPAAQIWGIAVTVYVSVLYLPKSLVTKAFRSKWKERDGHFSPFLLAWGTTKGISPSYFLSWQSGPRRILRAFPSSTERESSDLCIRSSIDIPEYIHNHTYTYMDTYIQITFLWSNTEQKTQSVAS